MDTLLQSATSVSRRPYQRRTLITSCTVCGQWSAVPDRATQDICKEAGACLRCMKDPWLLRVQIVDLEVRMESIVKRAQSLPEDRRGGLRMVYAKRARQLATARAKLEKLNADNQNPPQPAHRHAEVEG